MSRRYIISRRSKERQMIKAKATRLRKYGKYLSDRGVQAVKHNLVIARAKKMMRRR